MKIQIYKILIFVFFLFQEKRGLLKQLTTLDFPMAVVCSYRAAGKIQEELSSVDWQTVTCDEAHAVKNYGSQAHKVVRNLQRQFVILLSGTPLQNNSQELINLLMLLIPEKNLPKFNLSKTNIPTSELKNRQTTVRALRDVC